MTSLESRLGEYWNRRRQGIDTHRDDIGTLQERKNKYLLMDNTYTRGHKEYLKFKCKVDILLTLLEDGKISTARFNTDYKLNQADFQSKMDRGIVRSGRNLNEERIKRYFKHEKMIKRLREIHALRECDRLALQQKN